MGACECAACRALVSTCVRSISCQSALPSAPCTAYLALYSHSTHTHIRAQSTSSGPTATRSILPVRDVVFHLLFPCPILFPLNLGLLLRLLLLQASCAATEPSPLKMQCSPPKIWPSPPPSQHASRVRSSGAAQLERPGAGHLERAQDRRTDIDRKIGLSSIWGRRFDLDPPQL